MKVDRHAYEPQFLVHMLYTGPPHDEIELASQGSTLPHFNVEDIGALPVLAPPVSEQREIVDWLEAETGDLTYAIARARRQVELLHEYRTRLIADVVTGKLDVREPAAQLSEEDEGPGALRNRWSCRRSGEVMRNRLHAITLKGFKTIHELNGFEPRPLTVLIGPNGAGKSNFISFFRMMSWMLADPDNLQVHVAQHGGASRLLHDGPAITREIEAEVTIETAFWREPICISAVFCGRRYVDFPPMSASVSLAEITPTIAVLARNRCWPPRSEAP